MNKKIRSIEEMCMSSVHVRQKTMGIRMFLMASPYSLFLISRSSPGAKLVDSKIVHHIKLNLNTHYFSDSAARFCPSLMCTYSVTLCQCYTLPVLAILYPPQVIANYELTNFYIPQGARVSSTRRFITFSVL